MLCPVSFITFSPSSSMDMAPFQFAYSSWIISLIPSTFPKYTYGNNCQLKIFSTDSFFFCPGPNSFILLWHIKVLWSQTPFLFLLEVLLTPNCPLSNNSQLSNHGLVLYCVFYMLFSLPKTFSNKLNVLQYFYYKAWIKCFYNLISLLGTSYQLINFITDNNEIILTFFPVLGKRGGNE